MYISDSIFNTLISLDSIGVIKRDMESESMVVNSLGNEYKIVLERRSKSLFTDESSTCYKCNMRFINIFGNEVITLLGDEIEISKFLDTIYYFLESQQSDVISQLSSYNGLCYIRLNREYDKTLKPLYNMIILRQDNVVVAVLKFDDETMSSLIDAMYFTFLIDIEQFEPNAPIYRYIDHDMWLADHREELGLSDNN